MIRRCAHRIRKLTGLGGQCKTQLAAERPLCTRASVIFFGPELGPYQHSLAPRRSILEHVSICSPSQIVHLHGKPYRLFFERELDGNAPISVRVIATSGITHGRKTVLPPRNPCDSDPFLVATHNRCSPLWDPHRLFVFRAEARTESHMGDISHLLFISTAEHWLAADRSKQIFLYVRSRMRGHVCC